MLLASAASSQAVAQQLPPPELAQPKVAGQSAQMKFDPSRQPPKEPVEDRSAERAEDREQFEKDFKDEAIQRAGEQQGEWLDDYYNNLKANAQRTFLGEDLATGKTPRVPPRIIYLA